MARLEVLLAAPRPLISRHTNPTFCTLQVRHWSAWKSPPSPTSRHPNARPSPLHLTQVRRWPAWTPLQARLTPSPTHRLLPPYIQDDEPAAEIDAAVRYELAVFAASHLPLNALNAATTSAPLGKGSAPAVGESSRRGGGGGMFGALASAFSGTVGQNKPQEVPIQPISSPYIGPYTAPI